MLHFLQRSKHSKLAQANGQEVDLFARRELFTGCGITSSAGFHHLSAESFVIILFFKGDRNRWSK
jgi:hypothetical protein